ncbi:hypothetical protein D018_0063B, partial [Vibrio parahaemolyticus VP2007-007]
KKLTIS